MSRRENVAVTLACGLTGEIVRTFGEVRLRVFGTSMVPSILPGDLISVQRAGVSEISIGEIVLYAREERLFAHRVVGAALVSDSGGLQVEPTPVSGGLHASLEAFSVKVEPTPVQERLITRGDRLRYDDPAISSAELVGRVISVERKGAKIDFSVWHGEWTRPLIRLLRASDFAANVYVRIVKLLPERARSRLGGMPLQPSPAND
jgi:signal peptidase I